jgi:ADP-ribose pyrophosphatase YjhB (NUDIX family)
MPPTRVIYGDRIGRQGRLRVGVSAVIFNRARDKILLTQRTDNGLWCLPSGGMAPGESAAETCVREVQEETALAVEVTRLIGIYTSPNWLIEYSNGSRAQAVAMCFECEIVGGDEEAGDEVKDLGYFNAQEIEKLELMASHRQRIRDAFEDQNEAFIR